MATAFLPTDLIVPHLRELNRNAADLREIRLMWRLIEASARMQSSQQARALMSMLTSTRQGLEQLEHDLLQSQVSQSAQEAMAELGLQARHGIDLLVRSLYERTADVGFLAADTVLCEAMARLESEGPADGRTRFQAGLEHDGLAAWQAPLQRHLQAYRAKYTVYDDIMLLDVQGQVRVRSRTDLAMPAHCNEAWLQQCLQQAGHVSHFGPSAIMAGADRLLYAQRLVHPGSHAVLGVLCLSFDFATEMQAIFAAGGAAARMQIGLLLSAEGQVIASSDSHWIAPGAQVPMHHGDAAMPLIHAGRTYLVHTTRALPYQGYAGPEGWQTQVMVPLELAFTAQQRPQALQTLSPVICEGLMAQARGFCPPLHAMARAADDIRRVVWNGQVLAASQPQALDGGADLAAPGQDPLQAVLEQMSETGDLTHAVFTRAIHGLRETALSTRLQEHVTLNRLLMDLLERNLYERANDCRWWALAPGLQQVLLDNAGCIALSVQAHADAQQLLEQLNALYTVYARIALYDRNGLVLACSQPDSDEAQALAPGSHIDAATLQACCALRDAQAYHVQQLDIDGRPVHVYHAAVRAPGGESASVIGGIALLFHTGRELQAMVQAAAPQHGAGPAGECGGPAGARSQASGQAPGEAPSSGMELPQLPLQAMYVTRDGQIIASSLGQDRPPAGARIEGIAGLASLADGEVRSSIEEIDGHYCIVGMAAGRGYREFRLDQDSQGSQRSPGNALAGLVSLSLQRLGPVHSDAGNRALRLETARRLDGAQQAARSPLLHDALERPVELASFYVGASLLALRAAEICEALPASAVAPVAAGRLPFCVGALARRSQGSVSGYVWVFDLSALLQGRPGVVTEQSQVIVVQHGGLRVGLLVSALQGVHRLPAKALVNSPMLAGGHAAAASASMLVRKLVHADSGLPLIQCLDPDALMRRLQPTYNGAGAPAPAQAPVHAPVHAQAQHEAA